MDIIANLFHGTIVVAFWFLLALTILGSFALYVSPPREHSENDQHVAIFLVCCVVSCWIGILIAVIGYYR